MEWIGVDERLPEDGKSCFRGVEDPIHKKMLAGSCAGKFTRGHGSIRFSAGNLHTGSARRLNLDDRQPYGAIGQEP